MYTHEIVNKMKSSVLEKSLSEIVLPETSATLPLSLARCSPHNHQLFDLHVIESLSKEIVNSLDRSFNVEFTGSIYTPQLCSRVSFLKYFSPGIVTRFTTNLLTIAAVLRFEFQSLCSTCTSVTLH